ncbi:hypothetical protein IEO21_10225 [Rhodonia placenta]|uniref:F-box domain-containing protein n=1 Tax=Rhodonia placenta TaxID=104341 RepID=A0A8H7TX58_9APHY|nr:hypothetical protein IEO21_10225 [Postia placenta]
MSAGLIFQSSTTGVVPTAMPLRPLPMEIWWQIIDELGAEGEYDALGATPEEVGSINVRQRWKGPDEVRIEGGRRRGERLPIPHLATFASRLARKWTAVRQLTIERAEWRMQDLDLHSLLRDFASFKKIFSLQLYDVTFPTVLTFWRLVCTFPKMKWLSLRDVKFVKTAIDARTFSALRVLGLSISGPCTFAEHGFNPRDIPLRPDMLSNLTIVKLGKAVSLGSDPQSVHDLVDLLIQSGASRRLSTIDACLSPFLRVATSIDVALNRLVKHAGASLGKLILHVLPQDSLPLLNEASTYAAPSTGEPRSMSPARVPIVTHRPSSLLF